MRNTGRHGPHASWRRRGLRGVCFLIVLGAALGCKSAPAPAGSFVGHWVGRWHSSIYEGAEGRVDAELFAVSGGLQGKVTFESRLGTLVLAVAEPPWTAGVMRIHGKATAGTGSLAVEVSAHVVRRADSITGTYRSAELGDAGTLFLEPANATGRAPEPKSRATPPIPTLDLSTPQSAAAGFMWGMSAGDAELMLASCLGTEEERGFLVRTARGFAAIRKLEEVSCRKLGQAYHIAGFPRNEPAAVEADADLLRLDGDEAVVANSLKVRRGQGGWKVEVDPGLRHELGELGPCVEAVGEVADELAAGLEEGRYATLEELHAAAEAGLRKRIPHGHK